MSVHNTKDEHTVVYVYHETLYNSIAYWDMDISQRFSWAKEAKYKRIPIYDFIFIKFKNKN